QAAGDPDVDHRADLYAFGALAYELLVGATPFAGRSAQATLAAHVLERPVPVGDKRADAPARLAALVMQCLEKDPALRPASALELIEALEGARTPDVGHKPAAGAKPSIAVMPF